MIQDEVAQSLCDLAPFVEMPEQEEPKTTSIKTAHGCMPMMSLQEISLGPAGLLDMIEEVWSEVEATTESDGIGVSLREVLAQDLFKWAMFCKDWGFFE